MLRNLSSIIVGRNGTVVFCTNLWVGKALAIVTYGQNKLVGDEAFVNQFEGNGISHLLHHDAGFLVVVGALQDLPVAQGVCLGPISLHGFHRARFPAPGMVDEQFGIDTKQIVEEFFVA